MVCFSNSKFGKFSNSHIPYMYLNQLLTCLIYADLLLTYTKCQDLPENMIAMVRLVHYIQYFVLALQGRRFKP